MIHRLLAPLLLLLLGACATTNSVAPGRDVTITRDEWGIAHVRGRTDADAVFGMIYAQAEDDFPRIEANYLTALGRTAEAEGEAAIWADLRARLYYSPEDLQRRYEASPDWLKRLMDAWAAGLNHYLATHPDVRPRVITRFEPWMALSFSEGSIGGDIERISLDGLRAFYGPAPAVAARELDLEPRGSNGIAIAPRLTENGRALLLINPHTSFFFRSELQVTSDEGLNAYGAATWGQFFIYQGFNDRLGWMHTSSGVDVVDEFLETIVEQDGRRFYRYGGEIRPIAEETVEIAYRTAEGGRATRTFRIYRTHRGPIVRAEGGRWVSFAMMHRPVEALIQSFQRTKARNFGDYMRAMELRANSSNNTLYADADGNIAYLHPQFIPRRSDRFDYTRPVDGSDPASDWNGLHGLDEAPFVHNPGSGWAMNTNNWPYSAAGPDSPRGADFPRYMDTFGETPRGRHAIMLLQRSSGWTIDRLQAAAYDSYQPSFADLVPTLVSGFDGLRDGDPLKRRLAEPVAALRGWDFRWGVGSVPNTLGIFWLEELMADLTPELRAQRTRLTENMAAHTTAIQKLRAFERAVARLERDFGTWRTPWGEVNRFQRLTGDIVQPFSDRGASIPVSFTSGLWGSLASFGARVYPGTTRWYGTSGNSFVAIVEFGPDGPRARAVSAGGESGDPRSPHFNDQARRYADGNLREVYFTPEQVRRHAVRTYRP